MSQSGIIQATLEVQLSKRVKKQTENLIRNTAELKDLYWNSIIEKVVSLWEIQLLINEGYLRDIYVGQWKIERWCFRFCCTLSQVSRGAIDSKRNLMLKVFKLCILQNDALGF